jgi:nitroimidazol reductase NimA-like FMN-containing flavoprotein (pyridoxamine 5'-phosphate oxidase superfamily)
MTIHGSRRPNTFRELDVQECLSLLASRSVGRVAFMGDDGILVFPVNHVLHEGAIYFRTSPYAALVERLRHTDRMSFQVDDFDEYLRAGWSVLVVGTAEVVEPHEALVSLPSTEHPEPWAAGTRTATVRIRPSRITGRRVLPG